MLSLRSLPARGLAYHWRGNVAVALGVAVGAAVLSGALFVGDSLRGSLRERAERQAGPVSAAWVGGRLIRDSVAERVLPGAVVPAMLLRGSVTADRTDAGDTARQSGVTVFGLPPAGLERFHVPVPGGSPANAAVVGRPLANRLGVATGDRIRLSVQQFSAVPRGSLLGRRSADDVTTGMTLTVVAVLPDGHPANDLSLVPTPGTPLNLFVSLGYVQDRQKQAGRANALLGFVAANETDFARTANAALADALTPEDLGLRVAARRKGYVSVESDQLLLEPPAAEAATAAAKDLGLRAEPTAVYLANSIAAGGKSIPYSIVAALDPAAAPPLGPFLPPGVAALKDDEIALLDWEESPLKAVPVGAKVAITFFKPEVEAGAEETTATFTLAGRVPFAGAAADPELTPPFPGITDKLRIGDWDPPFPFDNTRIKPGDANERFWERHKTTPKAYITRAAGERLFGSRFGSFTSVRVAPASGSTPDATAARLREAMRAKLSPAALGVEFEDTRARLADASRGGTDFGGLFLGFSLFLIVSALLLVGLLFRLTVERRAKEIGGLLADGYPPVTVRRLLLAEGLALTVVGGAVGVLVGVGYSRLLVEFLTALWPDPTVKSFLRPHATPASAAIGFGLTLVMALGAIGLAVRGLVKVAPPALLRGMTTDDLPAVGPPRRWPVVVAAVCVVAAVAAIAIGPRVRNPDYRAGAFFAGGGLLLAAGLLLVRRWLRADRRGLPRAAGSLGLLELGPRNAGRFPGRSLLTVGLLAAATFLLVAVESFRRRPDAEFAGRTGGSGGFNLLAEADVPVCQPFTGRAGQDDLLESLQRYYQDRPSPGGPSPQEKVVEAKRTLGDIRDVIPMRVRAGDDASCLNLYQASRPRVVGVPDALVNRGGFQFYASEAATPEQQANPWLLLTTPREDGAVPVIAEQHTALYMLKVGLGGELTVPDEAGRPVRCRIVATLADSPFQSELLMGDAAFRRLYPREEGYRLFLIETPPEAEKPVADILELGLRANGLTVTPTRERVAAYQAVIGTYLSTFQLLGGLGLFLGVLGLAVVILRGVWERLGELALLRSVGYRTRALQFLVIVEHALLLVVGLGSGVLAALASVAPHVAGGTAVPWVRLAGILGLVLGVGFVVASAATAGILRVPVIPALRRE